MSGDPGPDEGQQACCILEICCGGAEQVDALATAIKHAVQGVNAAKAMEIATWLLSQYDFAPVGTLKAFKAAIVANVKEYNPQYPLPE